MKLNMKLIAAAVALLAASSGANAALIGYNTGNGSVALYAFNTVTRAYYIRDTGFLLNDFLPSNVTTGDGDGNVTGTRTPEAGLLLNGSNTAGFALSSFTAWLGSQDTANIRWALVGGDSLSAGTNGVSRLLTTSAAVNPPVSNGQITNAVLGSGLGGLTGTFGTNTGEAFGTSGFAAAYNTNGGLGANTLASLDQSVGLYYFARTAQGGATGALATATRFGNSTGFATVTLESDGDFVYSLAGAPVSAVPIPAAAWLLGSGLLGLGGMIRRRKAAAQA